MEKKVITIGFGLVAVLLVLAFDASVSMASPLEASEAWQAFYSGTDVGSSVDSPSDIVIDENNNAIVTGKSMTAAGDYDFATIKYETDGNQSWVMRYNGPGNGNDEATAITIDTAGSVYVTGKSLGSGTGLDYVTIKYDASGNQLWEARYNGPGNGDDEAFAVVTDNAGYVYVTGKSGGAGTGFDYATIKYDADGNQLWVARFNGPADDDDEAGDLAVDAAQNVYVTGKSKGTDGDYDCATLKYDNNGDVVWIQEYNGTLNIDDVAVSIAVDAGGNVYIAGTVGIINNGWGVGDYGVIKYDADGNQLWMSYYHDSFGNGTESLNNMAIDDNGNVYVTGSCWRYSLFHLDYCTIKYDTNGNRLWVAFYSGSGENDTGVSLALDGDGSVVVTGKSFSAGKENCDTIKYDTNGAQVWATRYAGLHYARGTSVAIDSLGNAHVTAEGIRSGTWDYVTIKYIEGPSNQKPVANAGIDQTVHAGVHVFLDGTASYDQDNDYPLSYSWTLTSQPTGSAAELENPDTGNPSFTADLLGDYSIQLVVTDSRGAVSFADSVMVSTFNSAPVADTGPDQSVIQTGTIVYLDGTQSWDDDGDSITYEWALVEKPEQSLAELSDISSSSPTFIADVHGLYKICLVVSDPWTSSAMDQVLVSFENIIPVAVPGVNQSVLHNDTVYLDGSNSYDANLDPLTYQWSIISKPAGSVAELNDPSSDKPEFVADLSGDYLISLMVNDGYEDSIPQNVGIYALSYSDAVTENLTDAITAVNDLDLSSFKNPKMRNALTNKINAALSKIEQGQYEEALNQLIHDVLKKTDGCALIGYPDNNDWVKDCSSQEPVYNELITAIDLLNNLV